MFKLHEGIRISNYLLDRRLGSGSFGEVWRARHHILPEVVAIKIPTDTQYVRNLRREGVTIHGLKHPNIVRAIDLDPYAEPPYLVMECIEGPSLRIAIDEWRSRFPIPAAAVILRGVLGALVAAHEAGVIHRDIKPGNILLNHPLDKLASITEQSVKVTDFGLGKIGDETHQLIMQSTSLTPGEGDEIAGTLAYMSPEQRDGGELDRRSDLYSCGIVLFEMLTGERPQGNELPSSLRPQVSTFWDEVFRRSYARLERRFPSATEMLSALSSGASGVPPPLPQVAGATGIRCPACDAILHRDDQFCIRCGKQLVASVPRCANCHSFVQAGDQFCIYCGNDLRVLQG